MRILIADDHGVVRQGLRFLLNNHPGTEVVGEAENGIEVVRLAKELSPDVIIMDISMPHLNGIQATEQILKDLPEVKIVALSMYFNRRFVLDMLKAGAMGYVLKSYLFDELIRALESVAEGEHYLSPRVADVLIDDYLQKYQISHDPSLSRLSDRERQILQLLAEGQSTKAIAIRLNISPKTADANRRQLMEKLGISSVAELTKYAIREGFTSLEF
jgi:DNA-binding NarL/FixJ family response regulator